MSRPAPLLLLIALASALMLAGALVAQHVFGWEPCTPVSYTHLTLPTICSV